MTRTSTEGFSLGALEGTYRMKSRCWRSFLRGCKGYADYSGDGDNDGVEAHSRRGLVATLWLELV